MKKKRKENEKKFGNWTVTDSGRIYFFEVKGRKGWKARYVKEVDANENTLKFCQEIYNEKNVLVEVHEKFPIDNGHKKLKQNGNH
ncbi:MAG: hypothetical protein WCI97_06410 [Bacteroidota bacterium]